LLGWWISTTIRKALTSMNLLSLFAGIGGVDLGLERAGMTTVGQVELDPFCRQVLAKHWPEVPRHNDVRTFDRWWRSRPRPAVDVVAGGFPCQPFSIITGNRRRGTADHRWGWPWMADVIAGLQQSQGDGPDWVLIENVPALIGDAEAFEWVLEDLAGLGFDGEWGVVSACAVGAPHTRERLFVVAYSDRVARALAGQRLVWPADLRPARRFAEGVDGGGGSVGG
jgi:DNA (cytosine-5)-methyltransferase 1